MSTRFCVGLTGGIGSGKSAVAHLFADLGAAVIDTDLIAHQLTALGGLALPAIRQQFGDHFIAPDGALDRAAMRAHVFADPPARKELEALLHPLIRAETERAAQNVTAAYTVFVVPLLVESGSWRERVQRILVVDCDEETQIARVMQRNGFSRAQVEAIMHTQASRAQRLQAADDVLQNQGGLDALEVQVRRLHQGYLQLAGERS